MRYSADTVKRIDSIPIDRFFPEAERKGNKLVCRCPSCKKGEYKKSKWHGLQITVGSEKNMAKCFQCGFSVNGAINTYAFLHNLNQKSDFIKILRDIADETGTPIEEEKESVPKDEPGKPIPGSSAYKQLKASGLTVKDITAEVLEGDIIKKVPTFQKGSLNIVTGEINYSDDETVILYYDLEGRRKTFMPVGARSLAKVRPYTRVRWSNPDLHLDKNDKPIKYQTPLNAKLEIYIPQMIREAYKARKQFDTLFIQEGEKKAEKACKHGIPSIAIQGISMIGRKDEGLPAEIQYLTQACGIKNIVLIFDSDWQNLSKDLQPDDDVDLRPRTFMKAAIKFRNYVRTLHQSKIHVDIWFGHVNPNNAEAKGIDDLLCGPLEGKEDSLKDDIDAAMIDINGKGEWVTLHNISTSTDYQIGDYWCLNSKEKFFEVHRDQLIKLRSFRFDKVFYTVVDGEPKQASEFGTGKEFWYVDIERKNDGREERKVKFSIIDTIGFLQANGFRSHVDEEGNNTFVRIDRGIIYKKDIPDIHRFIFSYVTKATREKDVHEYFADSMAGRLSQGKLVLIEPLVTNAGNPEQYTQRFYYRNSQVAISENGISSEPLKGPVWEQNLISRSFRRVQVIRDITRDPEGNFNIELTEEGKECEFLRFLINTSSFMDSDQNKEILDNHHLMNKITCIGYLLRSFKSFIETKAVIGMDARMSEVGESNGRSGKSIIGMAIARMVEQTFVPGRTLQEQFIFSEVRKTTRNVFIDDVRVNFDIANIYSDITGDMSVNVKQGSKFTIPFELAPKIYITTNHAIKSEGDSTEARTIYMAFSSHYSERYTPVMEFGHQFFSEWDEWQWSLFDNLMLECVYWYFKSIELEWGQKECGAIRPPMTEITLRRERQFMGEAFLMWAESYFAPEGSNINSRIEKEVAFSKFHKDVPNQAKFVTVTSFKKKLQSFCRYSKLHFNPHKRHKDTRQEFSEWSANNPGKPFIGDDDKSAGIEYITIANRKFFDTGTSNDLPY